MVLKLRKPKPKKKVEWDSSAVDNENMGKKKSKCKANNRQTTLTGINKHCSYDVDFV